MLFIHDPQSNTNIKETFLAYSLILQVQRLKSENCEIKDNEKENIDESDKKSEDRDTSLNTSLQSSTATDNKISGNISGTSGTTTVLMSNGSPEKRSDTRDEVESERERERV